MSSTYTIRLSYRDCDVETGRWLAKDPILFAGGSPNLYTYCHNDPVNYFDPWGLSEESSATDDFTNAIVDAYWKGYLDSLNPATWFPTDAQEIGISTASSLSLNPKDWINPPSPPHKAFKAALDEVEDQFENSSNPAACWEWFAGKLFSP